MILKLYPQSCFFDAAKALLLQGPDLISRNWPGSVFYNIYLQAIAQIKELGSCLFIEIEA